ncbi:MAG: InlB B-repeat-containing protein, partial [Firmicutes bacterium]|nr:InlB B-repeat-containing protein [Bacillota bacterium]
MKNRRSILCLLLAITLLLSQLPLSSTAVKAGEGDQYTVTYMDGDTVISTAEVESGQKAPIPEIPVKSGYGFFGWHSDSALTVRYDFNEPVTGNLTLYALFLPEVTGLTLHTEGAEKKDGGYALKADTLTVTFHTDAVPADLDKLELTALYSDKELTTLLTKYPGADTVAYFSVNMAAGSDEAPVVFWGDGLKTNCVLEAADGTIEFVELLRSPNSGSAMVICKYTCTRATVNVTYDANGGTTGDEWISMLQAPYGLTVEGEGFVCEPPSEDAVKAPEGMEFAGIEVGGVVFNAGDPVSFTYDKDLTIK